MSTRNAERFGMKRSLEYCDENYSPPPAPSYRHVLGGVRNTGGEKDNWPLLPTRFLGVVTGRRFVGVKPPPTPPPHPDDGLFDFVFLGVTHCVVAAIIHVLV